MKRKQQALSRLKNALLPGFYRIIILVLISFGCKSQTKYHVQAVYKVPNSDYTLIRVTKVNGSELDTYAILSEKKDIRVQGKPIQVGSVLELDLEPMDVTPMIELMPETRGSQTLYIDNVKIYDPKEKLYSSKCLNGQFLIEGCN